MLKILFKMTNVSDQKIFELPTLYACSYLTYWLLMVNELDWFKVDLIESWSISALASDSSCKVVNLSGLNPPKIWSLMTQ